MSYYFNKKLELPFDEAESRVIEELKKEGFGILTVIDVKEKFKEKINQDFRKYKILGACNPPFAYQALLVEDKIGTMLPCNVILQELGLNQVEIAVIKPLESMRAVANEKLQEIALKVQDKLKCVIDNL